MTGGYMYELSPAAVTGGFNVQRKEAGGVVTGELQYQNHASKMTSGELKGGNIQIHKNP